MTGKRNGVLGAAALIVLLLAGCSSSGGGIGDIFGGGGSNSGNNGTYANDISGTVDSVDASNRSILLTNVRGNNSMLSSGSSGDSVRVYFDNRTTVDYQGRSYRPEDLERGDQVTARVQQSGNSLVATSMSVTYDAGGRTTSNTYPSGNYPSGTSSTIRGTVRNVDTSRRTIEVDRGYNTSTVLVDYDANTYVTFGNRQYQVQDLERGDEIEIRTSSLNNGRSIANNIDVIRSISGTGSTGSTSSSSSRYATVRGTVRNIDTSRRLIDLDQTTWLSGFDSGAGSTGGSRTITIQYGSNASIEVNGQMQSLSGLERGDVIDVEVQNTSGTVLYADRMTLVRDVNVR